jgi:phosphoesterase RecJ-like protein
MLPKLKLFLKKSEKKSKDTMNKNGYLRQIKAVANTLEKYKTFFMAVHQNPDGDTLGAALCTASILKRKNKKVYIFSADKVPDNLKFMPFIKWVNEGKLPPAKKKFDVCILFECSTLKRAGKVEEIVKNSKKIINIDHHKTHSDYGHINYVDSNASSTSELVFKILNHMKIALTPLQAQYLYVGIVTDTGRFYYKSSTPDALQITAKLMDCGIKAWKINERLYGTKPLPALKLLSEALRRLEVIDDYLSVMHITAKDFRNAKALPEHTEDIANYGLMPEKVQISVLIKELPNCVAVNLRAKNHLDLSKIAKKFGGGGHRNAAGFKTKLSAKRIKSEIIKEIKILSNGYEKSKKR